MPSAHELAVADGPGQQRIDRFKGRRRNRPASLNLLQHDSEVGAQRAGLHERPRACRRAAPSTQCAFGFGRSQELGGGQPSHQIREIGEEIEALPSLDNLRIDEVDAPVIADQGEFRAGAPLPSNHRDDFTSVTVSRPFTTTALGDPPPHRPRHE